MLIVLLMPIYLVSRNLFIEKPADILFLVHRMLGLYAFSLIFIQIIIGSTRPLLNRLFPAGAVLQNHMRLGKIAFSLALLHPVFLYSTNLLENNLSYVAPYLKETNLLFYSLGIFSLLLLILSIGAALFRSRIGLKWIYIHRINYVIFWLIVIHSLNLGSDVRSPFGQTIYLIYGSVVTVLTLRRIFYKDTK